MKKYLILLSLLTCLGFSQQTLIVNGYRVEGLNTTLIVDTPYIPAAVYANILGAQYSYSELTGVASLELAGELLRVQVYQDPATAASYTNALSLNGQTLEGNGGVIHAGTVYIPVRPVALALGSSIDYIADESAVVVASPRAQLLNVEGPYGSGNAQYERFVLTFSSPVPVETFETPTLGLVGYHFDQADMGTEQRYAGRYFEEVSLHSNAGQVEIQLSLRIGSAVDMYTTSSDGQDFKVIIDILPEEIKADRRRELVPSQTGTSQVQQTTSAPAASLGKVVIDPGHGGDDAGLSLGGSSESQLTLQLATDLVQALEARGYEGTLTRQSDRHIPLETRSNSGVGVPLFISLHAEQLSPGEFKVYYLGEASNLDSLNLTLRRNAETELNSGTTDGLRRRILLNLLPDIAQAETLARSLGQQLERNHYRLISIEAVPLYVLGGAAGRGLLLEFSQHDLAESQNLANVLADSLIQLLQRQ